VQGKLTQNNTNSLNGCYMNFEQLVENYQELAGKRITMSLWAKSNHSNACFRPDDGVTSFPITGCHSGGGGWEFLTNTITIAASPTNFRFQFGTFNDTVASGKFVEVTNVMMNFGDSAAPFRLAGGDRAGEFNIARRYFRTMQNVNGNPTGITGSGSGTTSILWYVPMAEGMRTTSPTLNTSVGSIAMKLYTGVTATSSPSSLTNQALARNSFNSSGLTGVTDSAFYYIEGLASSVITLDAEL